MPFPECQPTKETAQILKDELLFQRATQTYIWAMPAIKTLGTQIGPEKAFGAGYNVLPVRKRLTDAKFLLVTPNTVTMYAVSYLDLGQDGPLVMDLPPMLQGFLSDYWRVPIPVDGGTFAGDVGFAGPDRGNGMFLLLPPGYKKAVPIGYYVYRSGTMNVLLTLRAFAARPEGAGVTGGAARTDKDLSTEWRDRYQADDLPDASGVQLNMLPSTDASAFEQLKLLLDREGDNLAGPDWLGMLASIGIVKSQPFTPYGFTKGT